MRPSSAWPADSFVCDLNPADLASNVFQDRTRRQPTGTRNSIGTPTASRRGSHPWARSWHGLVPERQQATGAAEREGAVHMLLLRAQWVGPGWPLGVGKNYDTHGSLANTHALGVTPRVSHNRSCRGGARRLKWRVFLQNPGACPDRRSVAPGSGRSAGTAPRLALPAAKVHHATRRKQLQVDAAARRIVDGERRLVAECGSDHPLLVVVGRVFTAVTLPIAVSRGTPVWLRSAARSIAPPTGGVAAAVTPGGCPPPTECAPTHQGTVMAISFDGDPDPQSACATTRTKYMPSPAEEDTAFTRPTSVVDNEAGPATALTRTAYPEMGPPGGVVHAAVMTLPDFEATSVGGPGVVHDCPTAIRSSAPGDPSP